MLACENYPALRDRQVVKLETEFPAWLGKWWPSASEFRLHDAYGGGVLCLRNLDDASKYQSVEFAFIFVDELTKNPEKVFTTLRGSLRWPGVERPQFAGATNPTGIGALWVRRLWIEKSFTDNNLAALAPEFAFLPGVYTDNPHLPEVYRDELDSLPDILRKAWRDGDWYAGVEGLVFPEFNNENITDKEPDPEQPIELAFDDGYIDPRAILFIQRTGTDILVFDELYQRQMLAERSVADAVARCEVNGWPLPQLAVGSPEAKELHARLRMANIPVRFRGHKVGEGLPILRRLILDGNGRRSLKVHSRCRNLIWELTEGYMYPEGTRGSHEKPMDGNDHAVEGLRHWCYLRAGR